MNHTILRLGTISALMALGGAAALKAQSADTYDPFMKIHLLTGSKTDEGQRNGFGFGFGTNIKMGAGSLGLELAYLTTPGQIVRGSMPLSSPATQNDSVYTMKHTTDAIGVRASYSMPLTEDWSWQVGVGVMHTKDRLESFGTFAYAPDTDGNPNGAWNDTPEKSSFMIQPYAGFIWRLSESGSLEFNVSAASVNREEVVPNFTGSTAAYKGVTPTYSSGSTFDVKIEVGYTFHF